MERSEIRYELVLTSRKPFFFFKSFENVNMKTIFTQHNVLSLSAFVLGLYGDSGVGQL